MNQISEVSVELAKTGVLTEHLVLSVQLSTLNVNWSRGVDLRWTCHLQPRRVSVDGRATGSRLRLVFLSHSYDVVLNRYCDFSQKASRVVGIVR